MSANNSITVLAMADGSQVHVGDKRRFTATVTDTNGDAATPTQFKMTFTPPSGSAGATVYAKTPSGSESAFDSETSNTFTANFTFDEFGWWYVTCAGSGNISEIEPVRVYVTKVP